LQGETLRLVAGDQAGTDADSNGLDCNGDGQLTGSYFPVGKSSAAASALGTFAAPSFDCAHPTSADEEEICADPDLSANDLRLNQAWTGLLPRLDQDTRRLLTVDQRLCRIAGVPIS